MNNLTWSQETMKMINDLTIDIPDKHLDPDWFLLRQRLEQVDRMIEAQKPCWGAKTGEEIMRDLIRRNTA